MATIKRTTSTRSHEDCIADARAGLRSAMVALSEAERIAHLNHHISYEKSANYFANKVALLLREFRDSVCAN